MIRVLRHLIPSPRTTRGKLGIAAFVTTFLVLARTTAGYAYWQTSLTATSTLDSAQLVLSTTNLTSATFTNDAQSSIGMITAKNATTTPSTVGATITVSLTATGSATLAANTNRLAWSTTDPDVTHCTVSAGTPTTWSTTQVLTATGVATGASVYWCVQSSLKNRDNVAVSYSANPASLSMTPTVSGTIAVGNYTATASATSTQSTSRIFNTFAPDTTFWNFLRPSNTSTGYPTYCLDVSGGGASTSGTQAISFGCKTSGDVNQEWKFTQVSAGSPYYNIQPRNATGLRLDNAGSTAAGAVLTVVTSSGATSQQWELQQTGASTYGFVNALSGLCMTSPTGTGQNLTAMLQQPCDGSTYQQFVVSQVTQSVACKVTGSNFVWTWMTAAVTPTETYTIVDSTGTKLGTATTSTSAGITTSTFTYPTSSYSANAVGFVDGTGTNIATGAMTRTGNVFFGYTYNCSMSDMS